MATQESKIKITADVKDAQKKLDDLDKKLKGTGDSSGKLSSQFGSLGSSFDALSAKFGKGKVIIAAVTASMVALYASVRKLQDIAELGNKVNLVTGAFERFNQIAGIDSVAQLERLNRALGGTVSNFELMQKANQAVQLGLDPTKLDDLAASARKLGAAVGRDAVSSFDDLVTGVGRGSRLILDNLGVIIKADSAYTELAASLNKTTKELTFQEKALYEINKSAAKLPSVIEGAGIASEQLNASIRNGLDDFAKAVDGNESLKNALNGLDEVVKTIDFKALGDAAGKLGTVLVGVGTAVAGLATAFVFLNKVAAFLFTGSTAAFVETKNQVEDYNDTVEKAEDAVKSFLGSLTVDLKKSNSLFEDFGIIIEKITGKESELAAELSKTNKLIDDQFNSLSAFFLYAWGDTTLENLEKRRAELEKQISLLNRNKELFESALINAEVGVTFDNTGLEKQVEDAKKKVDELRQAFIKVKDNRSLEFEVGLTELTEAKNELGAIINLLDRLTFKDINLSTLLDAPDSRDIANTEAYGEALEKATNQVEKLIASTAPSGTFESIVDKFGLSEDTKAIEKQIEIRKQAIKDLEAIQSNLEKQTKDTSKALSVTEVGDLVVQYADAGRTIKIFSQELNDLTFAFKETEKQIKENEKSTKKAEDATKKFQQTLKEFAKLETARSFKRTTKEVDKFVESIKDLNTLDPTVDIKLKADAADLREQVRQNAEKLAEEFYSKFEGKVDASKIQILKDQDIKDAVDKFDTEFSDSINDRTQQLQDEMEAAYKNSVDFWTSEFEKALNGDFDLFNLESALKKVAAGFAGSLLADISGGGTINLTGLGQQLGSGLLSDLFGGAGGGSLLTDVAGSAGGAAAGQAGGAAFGAGVGGGAVGAGVGGSIAGGAAGGGIIATIASAAVAAFPAIAAGIGAFHYQNFRNAFEEKGTEKQIFGGATAFIDTIFFGLGTVINKVFGGLIGGGGHPERLAREGRTGQIEDVLEEETGRRTFASTTGERTLDSFRYDVGFEAANTEGVIMEATGLVAALGDIFGGGSEKLSDDLTGIFAAAVGANATFEEAILNTMSLMGSLGLSVADAKEALKDAFLSGQLSLDEFGADLQNLNFIAQGLFVPGQGGIVDAVEIAGEQLASGNFAFALEALEILMNEAAEEGILSFTELADYLEGQVAPAIVDMFRGLGAQGIETFFELSDASADQIFATISALDPLAQAYMDINDEVQRGEEVVAKSTESNVANLGRQADAAGELAGKLGKAADAARELNDAIASRPSPAPAPEPDLGKQPG